jgi:hypothetical protein
MTPETVGSVKLFLATLSEPVKESIGADEIGRASVQVGLTALAARKLASRSDG